MLSWIAAHFFCSRLTPGSACQAASGGDVGGARDWTWVGSVQGLIVYLAWSISPIPMGFFFPFNFSHLVQIRMILSNAYQFLLNPWKRFDCITPSLSTRSTFPYLSLKSFFFHILFFHEPLQCHGIIRQRSLVSSQPCPSLGSCLLSAL